jgi:hypothetical protein
MVQWLMVLLFIFFDLGFKDLFVICHWDFGFIIKSEVE